MNMQRPGTQRNQNYEVGQFLPPLWGKASLPAGRQGWGYEQIDS